MKEAARQSSFSVMEQFGILIEMGFINKSTGTAKKRKKKSLKLEEEIEQERIRRGKWRKREKGR